MNLHAITKSEAPKDTGRDERMMDLIREMREDAKEQRALLNKLLLDGVSGKTEKKDPIAAAKEQAVAMNQFGEAMLGYAKSLGYKPPGSSTDENGNGGRKTIEEIREENRHKEEMLKLNADRENKAALADTLADIPVMIGKGMTNNMVEGAEKSIAAPATRAGIGRG